MILVFESAIPCNQNCRYCYQRGRRLNIPINLPAVIRTIRDLYEKYKEPIVLHGGEPLLLPLLVIEAILKISYELTGQSSICTGGVLINENHIKLFKKYNTQVDISIDGFPEQNVLRLSKQQTQNLLEKIDILLAEKIKVNVMSVLHEFNRNYADFVYYCYNKGIDGIRINFLKFSDKYSLSLSELKSLSKKLLDFCMITLYDVLPFTSIIESYFGNSTDCFLTPCDPFSTSAARNILPNGKVINCTCTQLPYTYQSEYIDMRSYILYKTDCRNCKFFYACKGGCPGNQDWRRKDIFCPVYRHLFSYLHSLFHYQRKQEEPPLPPKQRKIKKLFPGETKITEVNGITQIERGDEIVIRRN